MQRFPQTECLTKIISTLVIQFSIKMGRIKMVVNVNLGLSNWS